MLNEWPDLSTGETIAIILVVVAVIAYLFKPDKNKK